VDPARPVTLELGAILGLKGVAAAVLGGMGSARGAMAAGLALGVLESVLTNLALPAVAGGPPLGPFPQFHDLAAPVLLLAALCLAPRLLGAREPEVD
jgi:branched-chain amino acid transport system permease protein